VIDEAQLALDYTFRQPELLQEALTHKSYLQGKQEVGQRDNERLEFLGDAVLAFVISEYVTSACPASREGELSKVKARLVSGHSLGQVAQRLKLGEWLRLGRGEEKTKGREKTSLLANALEAVIAAIYLDGGIEVARSFILRIFQPELKGIDGSQAGTLDWDYKSRLQEWSHKHYETVPTYRTIQESGPDHEKAFDVEVLVKGRVLGCGKGKTRKDAEQQAARQALEQT
jgi:ribonuclease-3